MSDEVEIQIDPRAELIMDTLLELIGEVVKVSVLIAEIPEDNLQVVLPRLNAFVSAVNSLEIEETDPRNFGNNVGEA